MADIFGSRKRKIDLRPDRDINGQKNTRLFHEGQRLVKEAKEVQKKRRLDSSKDLAYAVSHELKRANSRPITYGPLNISQRRWDKIFGKKKKYARAA